MARQYKLVVNRLPRKVCVSIRAAKNRTLTKRKYVKYRKGKKGTKRRRKMKYQTFIKKCMKKHKNRSYRGKGGKMGMCARRYKAGRTP